MVSCNIYFIYSFSTFSHYGQRLSDFSKDKSKFQEKNRASVDH